jgi:hypothetical protein
MLNIRLPELQEIMDNLEEVLTDRLLGVEDELGVALVELVTDYGVPGGAVSTIAGKLVQQVKLNATAVEKVNQMNVKYVHLKMQFVGLYQN